MPYPVPALLGPGDDPPFQIEHGSRPDFLVVCDHASQAIPARLGDLGLAPAALDTHIAIDIGALRVARRVASLLDATLLSAAYSRLVIDCNRYPWDRASIAPASAGVAVPGNAALDEGERAARVSEIFLPYHRAIASGLEERCAHGVSPVMLSIHSCTPILRGPPRPWPIGLSYVGDAGLSRRVIGALRGQGLAPVGDNEPYTLEPGEDYTVPEHALRRGLDYVQVEFRQDLLGSEVDACAWAERFVTALRSVYDPSTERSPPWQPAWGRPHGQPDARAILNPPAA